MNDDAEDIGNIDLSIEANARNSFYVMTVLGSEKTLDDNVLNLQDVRVSLISKGIDKSYEEGTYVLHADQYGQVNILGDIDIAVVHGEEVNKGEIGANGIYAENYGVINLGSEDTTTRVWTISDKPDSISSKYGSQVNFISTNNQIVGSMDLLGKDPGDTSSGHFRKFNPLTSKG